MSSDELPSLTTSNNRTFSFSNWGLDPSLKPVSFLRLSLKPRAPSVLRILELNPTTLGCIMLRNLELTSSLNLSLEPPNSLSH